QLRLGRSTRVDRAVGPNLSGTVSPSASLDSAAHPADRTRRRSDSSAPKEPWRAAREPTTRSAHAASPREGATMEELIRVLTEERNLLEVLVYRLETLRHFLTLDRPRSVEW